MKIIGDNLTLLLPIIREYCRKRRESFSQKKNKFFFCHFDRREKSGRVVILVIGLLFIATSIFAQGTLSGKVTDADTGEPILFGDVVLYKNGELVTGEQTDFDGNYTISTVDVGVYKIVFHYVGYKDTIIEEVLIEDGQETVINGSMRAGIITHYEPFYSSPPIIEQDNFEKGQTFTSRQIRRMPNKS